MKTKMLRTVCIALGLCLPHVGQVLAQDQDSAAAQANNPLANMTAFNIQDYYIGDLSNLDKDAN